ncbi:GNAT family N-acetyltransferase [Nocardioides sp.]|uniref:GNAT family N-acetyltransferase n=1 Tax=Nocardioides sp. TaxID=35761 RepID=UPI002C9251D2|nr:GNAT family N-acetyltransferase [Nocardioides sp.]HXH80662.1 GNAT family N-acetyltransferase [Nocardioides sp.]
MTSSDGVQIRPAVPDDAEPLAQLQIEVWEDAYGGLMPASVFEHRRATLDDRVDRWRQILDGAPSRTTVAEVAGALVGFASIGPPRDDDVIVDEELWALYVLASWWGKRVGHSLLAATLADRASYLWVLCGNDRAIEFYRKHGFTPDGVTRRDDHGDELRMTRQL